MLSKDDRIAFSLQIVSSDSQIRAFDTAKAQLQVQINTLQKLDTANANLYNPVNVLINSYHNEYAKLDGNVRSSIIEQDIVDSANKKINNFFFPNNINTAVPSLTPYNNIWAQIKPFAITYAIGKNYVETYPSTTQKEADLINPILTLISNASAYSDIENTTGQICTDGTCDLPQYLDQPTCVANSGVWTPGPDTIVTYPDVQTLKTNIVSAVNTLKTFLLTEVSLIPTNDPDTSNQSLNNAAINDINNVILAAINTWLGYVDFNTSHGQTTCAGFNSYNSNLLAPTKLHSTQLSALQLALNSRLSFITTRISQLSTILGNITQNLTNGDLTSSTGLYGKRYGYLSLRLNALGGSLSQLASLQAATNAQDAIKANTITTKNTYMSFLPTTLFKSPGSGSSTIHLVDTSFLSVGDTVFIIAENQEELQRAVKSISGNMVILNDTVPEKYIPSSKARLYKDLT